MTRPDRRLVLRRLGWGLAATSSGTAGVASVSLLFPRVQPRLPSELTVGPPSDYRIGEVSERFLLTHRLTIVREEQGLYALSAVCTHLGCIARWQPSADKFKCFCHGSGFRVTGEPFEGPAPRPLERLKVALDRRGRVVVDTAVKFRKERGEWTSDGSYLAIPSDDEGTT